MIMFVILTTLSVIYTVLVKLVDVAGIGPEGSEVGFAGVNGWFHGLTGVNMELYEMTDLISVVPFAVVGAFALIGLIQWIRRKKLLKVDVDILALGVFYVLVLGVFALFEVVKLNYRPVLIEGALEASYPSSTTMLAICVFASAAMVVPRYLSGWKLGFVEGAVGLLMGFMVVVRLMSGVHWLTDIIGGILISATLLSIFLIIRKAISAAWTKKSQR